MLFVRAVVTEEAARRAIVQAAINDCAGRERPQPRFHNGANCEHNSRQTIVRAIWDSDDHLTPRGVELL